MKDFKNSTKMQSGHSFLSQHGFTGSSGQSMEVKPYTRKAPQNRMAPPMAPSMGPMRMKKGGKCYAEGGSVGNSAVERKDPVTQFDAEHGGKGPLASGFKKGGALKRALGGPVTMKAGGKSKKGYALGGAPGIPSKTEAVSHRPAATRIAPPRGAGFGRTPLIGQRR